MVKLVLQSTYFLLSTGRPALGQSCTKIRLEHRLAPGKQTLRHDIGKCTNIIGGAHVLADVGSRSNVVAIGQEALGGVIAALLRRPPPALRVIDYTVQDHHDHLLKNPAGILVLPGSVVLSHYTRL